MKFKTLAVALTLTLMCSLTMSVVPVSAGKGGGPENASENSPHFYFEVDLSYTGRDVDDVWDYWTGRERDVTDSSDVTVHLPGTVRHHGNATYFYSTDGTFGSGTAELYMEITDNFQGGKRICDWTFTLMWTEGPNIGSFVLEAQRLSDFNGWTPTTSNPYKADWSGKHGNLTVHSGEGYFEGFKASPHIFGADMGAGSIFGTAHFATSN